MKNIFAVNGLLGCKFLYFSMSDMHPPFFSMDLIINFHKSLFNVTIVSLKVICHLSLGALKIFSLLSSLYWQIYHDMPGEIFFVFIFLGICSTLKSMGWYLPLVLENPQLSYLQLLGFCFILFPLPLKYIITLQYTSSPCLL